MKKGVILYVTKGKEEVPMQGLPDLLGISRSLNVSAVWVATSEDEVAYGWWHLLTRGMHQVSCLAAAYDPELGSFEPHGRALRLCG
jgi:hypothetical protein